MKIQRRMTRSLTAGILLSFATTQAALAQTPLQKSLGDLNIAEFWTYDDLELGMKKARESGKPLLVTIRCVPCHACKGMDQQVINPSDLELLNLMNQFVCVRIVQAWALDLTRFQYDMNQSWAAFMINADGDIYGRYGTRAAQRNDKAITVAGFRKALDGALRLHRQYLTAPATTKREIAAKTGPTPRWNKPDDIPVIQKTVRWGKPLGKMTGNQQAECLHCHFVPAAEMMSLLDGGRPITDQTLWAYPLPETVGWSLDPKEVATLTGVDTDSPAERAGFQAGDRIERMQGQPILSIADVQWVLHQAEERARIPITVRRNGKSEDLELSLTPGWRRKDEFVSRVSSWDFFKVKLFGVNQLDPLPATERAKLNLEAGQTALKVVKLTPGWGGMNLDARKAGLKEGDVIVGIDGQSGIHDHSTLLAYLVQKKRDGDELKLEILRDSERLTLGIPLNWSNRMRALRKP